MSDKKTIDDLMFEIEDYVGGNIEGQDTVDRMAFTVFLRRVLNQQRQELIDEVRKSLPDTEMVSEEDYKQEVIVALNKLEEN